MCHCRLFLDQVSRGAVDFISLTGSHFWCHTLCDRSLPAALEQLVMEQEVCAHYNGLLILILQSRRVPPGAEAGEALLPTTFWREEPVVAAAWLFVSTSQTSLLLGLLGNTGWSHHTTPVRFHQQVGG